ncbi:MAG: hypothetical protein ABIE22_05105 [archaeon]
MGKIMGEELKGYEIGAEMLGTKLIYMFSVPVKALTDNRGMLERDYKGEGLSAELTGCLASHGIPTNLDWEDVVLRLIAPNTELGFSEQLLLDRIDALEVKGENLLLFCTLDQDTHLG